MDEHLQIMAEIARLAEAADRAGRLRDDADYSICSQPTGYPVPQRPTPEEEALRDRLQRLTRDQQAAVQATFWLGRDHSRPGEYPALLEGARRNLDRFDRYLMEASSFADSLRKGLEILRP